jgi:hypothetical protein
MIYSDTEIVSKEEKEFVIVEIIIVEIIRYDITATAKLKCVLFAQFALITQLSQFAPLSLVALLKQNDVIERGITSKN